MKTNIIISMILGMGLVGCSAMITFKDYGDPNCGNGELDPGEECDEGDNNSDNTPDACRENCKDPHCGDGVWDTGEVCDDGPKNGETGKCNTQCTGIVGDGFCGDGDVVAPEVCDDGDLNGTYGACNATCSGLGEHCGDVTLQSGQEECDQGDYNSDTTPDACRENCVLPWCGDNVTDPANDEECDDGGFNSDTAPDACRTGCFNASCGDGVMDTGEECDGDDMVSDLCSSLGYDSGGLSCTADCHLNPAECTTSKTCLVQADLACGVSLTAINTQVGSTDNTDDWCGVAGNDHNGRELIWRFQSANLKAVTVQLSGLTDNLDLFVLRDVAPTGCGLTDVCVRRGQKADTANESVTFTATAGTEYFIVVDGVNDAVSPFDLSVTCNNSEDCDDGSDNNGDALIDCDDPECFGDPSNCALEANCIDGQDNDGDGLTDCADPDCDNNPVCGKVCEVHGTLVCNGASQSGSNNQPDSTDYITQWCSASPVGGQTGNEYVYALTVASNTHAGITLKGLSADLSLFVVDQGGTGGGCSAESCVVQPMLQPGLQSESAWVLPDSDNRTVFVAVDAPNEGAGDFQVDVKCWTDENCFDGADNDGDGLKDCFDPDCISVSGCTESGLHCSDGVDNDGDGMVDCDDVAGCQTHSYCMSLNTPKYSYYFSNGLEGWSVGDGSGDGYTWEHCDPGVACTLWWDNQPQGAAGGFAVVDSLSAGPEMYLNETLTSPLLDFQLYQEVYLRFRHEFKQRGVPQRLDLGWVEVNDGATGWVAVYHVGADESREVVLNLTSDFAGKTNVQVRFRYEDNGEWSYHWMIDSIEFVAIPI